MIHHVARQRPSGDSPWNSPGEERPVTAWECSASTTQQGCLLQTVTHHALTQMHPLTELLLLCHSEGRFGSPLWFSSTSSMKARERWCFLPSFLPAILPPDAGHGDICIEIYVYLFWRVPVSAESGRTDLRRCHQQDVCGASAEEFCSEAF